MAKCSYNGSTFLVGGVKAKDLRFCNQKYLSKGVVLAMADQVPRVKRHDLPFADRRSRDGLVS